MRHSGTLTQVPRAIGALALGSLLLLSPKPAEAASVESGFDLLTTVQATLINPSPPPEIINFTGAPDGIGMPLCGASQFNFGMGCRDTPNTDTIVHRLEEADDSGGPADTIPIEVVGLSLVSTSPIAGLSARILKDVTNDIWIYGNGAGASEMTIDFDAMTYSAFLDLTISIFDPAGNFLFDVDKELSIEDQPWSHEAPDFALIIPGVNYRLNGTDTSADFWPVGNSVHDDGDGTIHIVRPSTVPVPAALPLLVSVVGGLFGLGALRRRAGA